MLYTVDWCLCRHHHKILSALRRDELDYVRMLTVCIFWELEPHIERLCLLIGSQKVSVSTWSTRASPNIKTFAFGVAAHVEVNNYAKIIY